MTMWLNGELRLVPFGAVEETQDCSLRLEPLPGIF